MTRFMDNDGVSKDEYRNLNEQLLAQLRDQLAGSRRFTIEMREDNEAGQVVEKSDAGDAGKGGGE